MTAANDATLMIEDSLQPFRRDKSIIKTRDMHLRRLPWPREELLAFGDQPVELRVTLSYLVEPNPDERGWTRRHRYASHALRFAVKRSLETVGQFRRLKDKRTAKRVSDALGTATEMKAMKNYAGSRLSPWLGHLMVSRSETARPLLTPAR